MNIDATTKLCGLIGNPVKHSCSPLIHNTISQMIGNNMAYVTFCVSEEDVGKAVEGARALGILGMNVTVPHKSAVIPYLKEIDPLAQKIGAVNTLVRVEGGYKGYNTDILGLKRALLRNSITLKDQEVIILGAGGASRAINVLCAQEGAKAVYLLNRTLDKAKAIAESVNQAYGREVIHPMMLSEYEKLSGSNYICIQTSSVGLAPNVNDVIIDDGKFYEKLAVGVDIIYNPATTAFMKKCQAVGKPAMNGLSMLLYQGVEAYELWNQCKVSDEITDKVYEILKLHLQMK